MNFGTVDVSLNYYGKPYHTILSILTLLKFSRQHINTIFITVEKVQPHDTYGDIYKVIQAVKELVSVELYYPKYFYDLGTLDPDRVKRDQEFRWSIPYQYAMEKSSMNYLFIMHNDMVFHDDMIGAMLPVIFKVKKLAGTGSIGQCWSCPANVEKLCGGTVFQQYVPSQFEAISLHRRHNTPRAIKDIEILETGRVHPLPECRLNEYACLIDLEIYRKTTLPYAENVCFGGNWGFTADLGTGWFHQMVNQGYDFKHYTLEDYAIHSQFNSVGQGIVAYSNKENYLISEEKALNYLREHFDTDAKLNVANTILATVRTIRYALPKRAIRYSKLLRRQMIAKKNPTK